MKFEKQDENKNGGRKLLFKKAEKIIELQEALEKKSWTRYKEIQEAANRPITRTRK